MLQTFYPSTECNSTYDIDFQRMYDLGYRGIIFDIDNTLVPHGAPADEKAIALFEKLREIGFQTLLLSNNKEPRVKSFCEQVGSDYIFKAGKPKRPGMKKQWSAWEQPKKPLFLWGISCLRMCGGQNAPGCIRCW